MDRLLPRRLTACQQRRYTNLLRHKLITSVDHVDSTIVVTFVDGEDKIQFLRELLPEVKKLIRGDQRVRAVQNLARL